MNAIFDSIAGALRKGEKVTLPIGMFDVLEKTRPPLHRSFLGRVRVTYAQQRCIKFTPAEGVGGARGGGQGWREETIA